MMTNTNTARAARKALLVLALLLSMSETGIGRAARGRVQMRDTAELAELAQ